MAPTLQDKSLKNTFVYKWGVGRMCRIKLKIEKGQDGFFFYSDLCVLKKNCLFDSFDRFGTRQCGYHRGCIRWPS